MHRRNLERKMIHVELHVVAGQPHRPLIQAVKRAIFLPRTAFHLHLYAQFCCARLDRSQPDTIHARGLLSGREWLLSTKHERHFRALRPASVQHCSVAGYCAVPLAAYARNVKGKHFLLEVKIGARQAMAP